MKEQLAQFAQDLLGRVGGPLNFRLLVQPIMAVLFAILDGRKDASEARPPYFYALFTARGQRREMLRDGLRSVAKIFLIAIALDVVYQYRVFRWFYPHEALVVALVLAVVPYFLLRGLVNRLLRFARHRRHRRTE
jgi:hypothetical protein